MDTSQLEAKHTFKLSDAELLNVLEERCQRQRIVKILDGLHNLFIKAGEKMPVQRDGLRAAAGLIDLYRLNYEGAMKPKLDDLRISLGVMTKTEIIREEISVMQDPITYRNVFKHAVARSNLITIHDVRTIVFRMHEDGALRRLSEGMYGRI